MGESWKQLLEIGSQHRNSKLTDEERLGIIITKLRELGNRPACVHPRRVLKNPCTCLAIVGDRAKDDFYRNAVARWILKFAHMKRNEQVEVFAEKVRAAALVEETLRREYAIEHIEMLRCYSIPYITDDAEKAKLLYTHALCRDSMMLLLKSGRGFLKHAQDVSRTGQSVPHQHAAATAGGVSNRSKNFESNQRPILEDYMDNYLVKFHATPSTKKNGETVYILEPGMSKTKCYVNYAWVNGFSVSFGEKYKSSIEIDERDDPEWLMKQSQHGLVADRKSLCSFTKFLKFLNEERPNILVHARSSEESESSGSNKKRKTYK